MEIKIKCIEIKTFEDGHRELWRQLAETGSRSKMDMPIWRDERYAHLFTEEVLNCNCFACYKKRCCPIRWGEDSVCCTDESSPYYKWICSDNIAARKFYAKIISELPWTEKEWCEFYPTAEDDCCVCDAGSDVSGTTKHDDICSRQYSLTCQWANKHRQFISNKICDMLGVK